MNLGDGVLAATGGHANQAEAGDQQRQPARIDL
jgi:hypothetical protein